MDSAFQVFAVDDDPIVLRAIERMLRSHSIAVEGFTSPAAFSPDLRMKVWPACCST